jgi:hypothetical protein
MKLAIMQPYFLPYVGYFQLIAAVDRFVFLDDVNFINRGWINRNHLLLHGQKHRFTIPLAGASQNRRINEIQVDGDARWRAKLLRTIETAYRRAPSFAAVFPWVAGLISECTGPIGDVARRSVREACRHLSIDGKLVDSSAVYGNDHLAGAERIRAICIAERAAVYVNPPGGRELYEPGFFRDKGIELQFLEPELAPYPQPSTEFIPGLSILDVLMHCDAAQASRIARMGKLVA